MQYIFRCVLDTEEDVIRDIALCSGKSLQKLHDTILQVFSIKSGEMASFYRTDALWEQGKEIPLFDIKDAGSSQEMKDYTLADIFQNEGDRLLYIYDFLNMWTFYVELKQIEKKKVSGEYALLYSEGQTPEKAPEKHFTSDVISGELEDELFDDDYEDGYDVDDLNNIF